MDNNIQDTTFEVVEPTGAPTNNRPTSGLSWFDRFNQWLKKFFTSLGNFLKLVVSFLFGWLYRPLFAFIAWLVEKSPNFVKRIIYGGAGTSYSAVKRFKDTCNEQGREQIFISTNSTYKFIGFAIVTIAILTFFSTYLLFHINGIDMYVHFFNLPEGMMKWIHKVLPNAGGGIGFDFILLPCLMAAVLVYNMDALIVRSTNAVYKLLGTKSKKAQRNIFIASTVIRIIASIALSQLINGPLEVLIAGDSISEFQARELAVQIRRVNEATEAKVDIIDADRKVLRDNILNAYEKAENETTNSDRPGYGARAQALKDMADETKSSAQAEMQKFDDREQQLVTERDEKIAKLREEQGEGYFAKRDALGRLADENNVIWWMMLIIAIVLSAWELAPIFTKLIMDRTALDLMVEVEAKQMKDWRDDIVMTPEEQIQEFMETEYSAANRTANKTMDDLDALIDKTMRVQERMGVEMDEAKKIQYANDLYRIIDTWFGRIMDHKTMSYGTGASLTPPDIATTDEGFSSTSAATT